MFGPSSMNNGAPSPNACLLYIYQEFKKRVAVAILPDPLPSCRPRAEQSNALAPPLRSWLELVALLLKLFLRAHRLTALVPE